MGEWIITIAGHPMTTTTLADLERMSGGSHASMRDYLTGAIATHVAQAHPERRKAAGAWLRELGIEAVGIGDQGLPVVAGPGTGVETLLREIAKQVAVALDVRVDVSSFQGGEMGVSQEQWRAERFGSDQAPGVKLMMLNGLTHAQATEVASSHADAMAIRRHYRLDANTVQALESQTPAETPFFRLHDMPPKLRMQMQVAGWDVKQKPHQSQVYLLNQKDPFLAAAYLVAMSELSENPTAQKKGASAYDPEALRDLLGSGDSPTGRMMAQKLVRDCAGLGAVLATYSEDDLPAMRNTLLRKASEHGLQVPQGLTAQETVKHLEAISGGDRTFDRRTSLS